ncbi:MAG TPA: hypothetical protein VHU91_02480 [Mycobacteriales bacterium]|jgi:hypothetical protein|nr:hypothetical protein [Mycobacteriales bacterium]
MQLPNQEYLIAQGETSDGTGIPPHTPVFTSDELSAGKDSALAKARTVLGG